MSHAAVTFLKGGLVTAVGASALASCAAFRAKLNNPSETRFKSSDGNWIMAHQAEFDKPQRGLAKLVSMAAMAIEEAVDGISRSEWPHIPLLLCVAELQRPGRLHGLDDQLLLDIQARLGGQFAQHSAIVTEGRVGVATALNQARAMVNAGACQRVLVVAVDSLILWPTLNFYDREGRLLTEENPNGFMPGEGAGALLLGHSSGVPGEFVCAGIGFAREAASLDSSLPLRGDGLTQAMKTALAEARWDLAERSCYRIADNSGEQYYFKEASLALSRAVRYRKQNFELWHPAESMGEAGAATALACLVVAYVAATKQYAPARQTIVHFANDDGARAVILTCLT
jgi:3-oxoacyl-[acyl-carrier-protein] synthase I